MNASLARVTHTTVSAVSRKPYGLTALTMHIPDTRKDPIASPSKRCAILPERTRRTASLPQFFLEARAVPTLVHGLGRIGSGKDLT